VDERVGRGGEMGVLREERHVPSPSARAKTAFSLLDRLSLVRDLHLHEVYEGGKGYLLEPYLPL